MKGLTGRGKGNREHLDLLANEDVPRFVTAAGKTEALVALNRKDVPLDEARICVPAVDPPQLTSSRSRLAEKSDLMASVEWTYRRVAAASAACRWLLLAWGRTIGNFQLPLPPG
jgi:hypothetical protein